MKGDDKGSRALITAGVGHPPLFGSDRELRQELADRPLKKRLLSQLREGMVGVLEVVDREGVSEVDVAKRVAELLRVIVEQSHGA